MRLPTALPQIRSSLLSSSQRQIHLKEGHAPVPRAVLLMAAGVCAVALLVLSACASRPVVLPEMAVAESAVRMADNPSTAENAPAELLAAKNKLRLTREASARGEEERTLQLAQQAALDAQRATVRAQAVRAERAATESRNAARALEAELLRQPAQ